MQNKNLKFKILILGGGFGGVRCALDLEKKLKGEAEIILIDKSSFHLFVPALYEVASAYGIKQDPFAVRLKKTICVPYSDIFPAPSERGLAFRRGKIHFIQAEIFSIDSENKKIATRGGEILDYDYLVIALGGRTADFGISGVKEYAFQFKNLEDGLALNQKIDQLTKEVAAGTRNPPIKITVIGAGFTGIEVAAELACCVKKFARICNIKSRCERIILIEAAPKILPAVSDEERGIIVSRLTQLGVEVVEGVAVEEVKSDQIKLKNGKSVETDLVIWTAGIKAPDILKSLPSDSLTVSGKLKVDENLAVAGFRNTFAVGDNAEFINQQTGKPVPALAYIAVAQGKIAARNILRSLKGKKLISYNPLHRVWIAPIGGKYALAHLLDGINVKGFLGWIIREAVDFKYMLSILSIKKAISIMWQEITLFTKND